MKYFAAIQSVLNLEKMPEHQQSHVDFLVKMIADGHIYSRGNSPMAGGGLTIFQADTLDEARKLAESDPYVIHGIRHLELHEWAMKIGS